LALGANEAFRFNFGLTIRLDDNFYGPHASPP
jgi:hypothetical protein